jgi:hypothetical protein
MDGLIHTLVPDHRAGFVIWLAATVSSYTFSPVILLPVLKTFLFPCSKTSGMLEGFFDFQMRSAS